MSPEPMLTVLEAYLYFGAFLCLMVAGFAACGWWLLRDRP